MNRKHLNGFTLHLFGYYMEIVTLKCWPVCLAVYKKKNTVLIFRLEKKEVTA